MRENKSYITILNVISAFAVVCLHTNGCFWNFSTRHYWAYANITESLFYFAVPIFFMLSGATLLDYIDRYSTTIFLKKRFLKTLVPFIFWSLFAVLYGIFMGSIKTSDINIPYVVSGILNCSFIHVYWFFPPLFAIYLAIPILANINKNIKMSIYLYAVLIIFGLNVLIPFIIKIFNINLDYNFPAILGAGYLIYPLLGFLIDRSNLKAKYCNIFYLLAILGLLTHIIGTYILSINAGKIVQTYKGYTNVPCILYSMGIYILIKNYGQKFYKNNMVKNFFEFLKNYTFPIYLLHMFILNFTKTSLNLNDLTILYRHGMPFVIIPICILITYIIRKIPLGKYILPK